MWILLIYFLLLFVNQVIFFSFKFFSELKQLEWNLKNKKRISLNLRNTFQFLTEALLRKFLILFIYICFFNFNILYYAAIKFFPCLLKKYQNSKSCFKYTHNYMSYYPVKIFYWNLINVFYVRISKLYYAWILNLKVISYFKQTSGFSLNTFSSKCNNIYFHYVNNMGMIYY